MNSNLILLRKMVIDDHFSRSDIGNINNKKLEDSFKNIKVT